MHPTTLKRYQTRARNFYQNRCGSDAPDSTQICSALLTSVSAYQPNSFSTLKSALVNDQMARGNHSAAKAIQKLVNPVTAPGSKLPRKPKPKKVRIVSDDDFWELVLHLRARGFLDEALCVVLAYYLGVRPCEMRTVTVKDDQVEIIGGKKSDPLERGADRTLVIENPELLKSVDEAARWMSNCPRTDTAIRDRLRKECRALWPRRKQHPTLKSFRHQLGSNLKASGESDESLAYIMGHQSTDSISVYGDRRSGTGRTVYVRAGAGTDLSKVRKPKKPALFGRGQVVGRIEIPVNLFHWQPNDTPSTGKSHDA
ncbi:MAG TPA: site-specific integrase [Pseudomonas sp.]|nr:site-specific integrase [Pseudomonas sp.]